MKFKIYWKSLDRLEKRDFAEVMNTSSAFLSQIAYGHRSCSETLALAIERVSAGQVTVSELRPQFAEDLLRSGYVRQEQTQEAA